MSKKIKLKPYKGSGSIKDWVHILLIAKEKRRARAYTVLLLIIMIGLVAYFMSKTNSQSELSVQQEVPDIPFTTEGELVFISRISSDTLAIIDIEVADNIQERARGLMYRQALPDNGGMLFIHDYEEMQSFWMKNTYIPLDILFVNAQKEIVTIHVNTTPMKEWSYASTLPALYVVEVNAGFCARHGITEGDKIEYSLTD